MKAHLRLGERVARLALKLRRAKPCKIRLNSHLRVGSLGLIPP